MSTRARTIFSTRRTRRSAQEIAADERDNLTPQRRQAQQRDRRRANLAIVYVGQFDLAVEIADILDPLATRMARFRGEVALDLAVDLTDAVVEAVAVVAKMLAESDAVRRCAHLPVEERLRAVKMLVALAPKPQAPPEPDAAAVADRSWVAPLVDLGGRYSRELSTMLDRAKPSDHLRGQQTVSERIIDALRIIDDAALLVTRRLERAEQARRNTAAAAEAEARADREAARAELARLGVDVDAAVPPLVDDDDGLSDSDNLSNNALAAYSPAAKRTAAAHS